MLNSLIRYIILLILSLFPFLFYKFNNLGNIAPRIEIIIIFYLASFVREINILVLFIYGLFIGHLSFPYINIILLIIFYYLIISYRKLYFKKDFLIIWGSFSICCLIYLTTKYLIISLINWYPYNYLTLLLQAMITILCYPLLHYSINKI